MRREIERREMRGDCCKAEEQLQGADSCSI